MLLFRNRVEETLPARLAYLVDAEWVPWDHVLSRHPRLPDDSLLALFNAYHHILSHEHPILTLARRRLPRRPGRCHRCGSCCADLRPGRVSVSTYRRWVREGCLVADFHHGSTGDPGAGYSSWYFSGVLLKMCPFLAVSLADGKFFCSLHHLGRGHRPSACVSFRPNYPHCELGRVHLVY